ncbi:MAG: glycosyltransferase family 2 protein [Bacteroidota bacterium]
MKCFNFFNKYPDAGAIGVRMLDGKGGFLPESKRSFPTPMISFFKLSGLTRLFPHTKTFGQYHLGYLDEHQNHQVEVLAGAFMIILKKVLDITGGFDEQFFMYGEDVDLSYRIQTTRNTDTGAFYKNYYVGETSILHFKGESTKKGSLNYVRMFYLAMSQFVQKHYSSSRAGIFNVIIRTAIWFRALISLFKQTIKKTGLPILDGILIWVMFWLAKEIWIEYVKRTISYNLLLIYSSFTGFAMLFLAVSYYTGLYQKKFRFKDLWNSGISMLLILLAVYSLLPENIRFSRGIVLLGSLLSIGTLGLWRQFLLYINIIEPAAAEKEVYSLVVGTKEDAASIHSLTLLHSNTSPVKGIISPYDESGTLGSISEIHHIVQGTPVKELIFCESTLLDYKKIIEYYQQMPKNIKLRIHANGSRSIIGSDSKFYSGEVIGGLQYRLSLPVYRRQKRLTDVTTAFLMLIFFPVHFIMNPHPSELLKNIFKIIIGRKTWVGYTGRETDHFPHLPAAVLSPSGIPVSQNQLSKEAQNQANGWYAQEYEPLNDLMLIFRHYKYLGVS